MIPKTREELLCEARARPHRAGVKGYASYPIQSPEGVPLVSEILGQKLRPGESGRRTPQSQQGTKE